MEKFATKMHILCMSLCDYPSGVQAGIFRVKTVNTTGAFYWHGLSLIPAWISNYMPCKLWDENYLSIQQLHHLRLWMDK